MKTNPAITLFNALKESFSTRCKLLTKDISSSLVPIELPLATFNDENVVIFVEQGEGLILHDGGRLVDYLADHNILMPLKQKPYSTYFFFYEDLAQKHGFTFSKQHRRFEMTVRPGDGKEALIFAECLIALSFLVLTKSAGLKPFSFKDSRQLSGLQMTLTAAFSEQIRVSYGLNPKIERRRAPQDWGLTLKAPDESIQGCVYYLHGTTFSQLVRRALVFDSFARKADTWFNIEPDRYWGVYAGPPKFFEDTNAVLADVGNGSAKRVLRLNEEGELVAEITDRLGLSVQENWQDQAIRWRERAGETLFTHEDEGNLESDSEQLIISKEFDSASVGDQTNIEADSISKQFLNAEDYSQETVLSLLDAYGVVFAKRVLSRIKKEPLRVAPEQFNKIADIFLRYFTDKENTEAIAVVDKSVAEIEPTMERGNRIEQAFRDEENAINQFVIGELRSLKREVARLAELKGGG